MNIVPVALAAALGLLVAGCQAVQTDYRPDPTLQGASVAALKGKIASACVITQRSRSSRSTSQLQPACGCYANRTWRALDSDEQTFYRANGFFSETARAKGEAAIKACGLVM